MTDDPTTYTDEQLRRKLRVLTDAPNARWGETLVRPWMLTEKGPTTWTT